MNNEDKKHRSHLPMPNTQRPQFIAYDAKDPDSKFPPIEQLRPPKGAPNVLIVLIDDAGFGSSSAFGGPCQTPAAEKLAAGGLKFNRFHTTALCSPTRQALLTGRNHHSAGMGGITEIATGAPGYCSVLPNSMSPLARDAQAQRLLHGAVRQMPRSAGLADEPGRAVRRLAHRRRRLRVLLRLHRRRGEPVVPDALRRHHAGRAEEDARGGLPPRGGHDRQGDGLDRRSRRRLRLTSRSSSTSRRVPPTRRTMCRRSGLTSTRASSTRAGTSCAKRPLRGRKTLGVIPADCQLTVRSPGDPGVGRDAGGLQAGATPRDGGLRRLHGVHRPPRGPDPGRTEEARHLRRHAGLLHHRRQRRLGRGRHQRLLQRDELLQRAAVPRDAGVPHGAARQARRAGVLQPLCRGLGACDEHPVPVDQAGRLALGRDAQRHDRFLAQRVSRPRARSARSSTMSSTWRPRSSRRPEFPSRSR